MRSYREQLEAHLSPHRLDHTLGVTYTAAALSFVHGVDLTQAMTAGMLHDCAKYLSDEEMLSRTLAAGIEITEIERRAPSLLHAKLGAYLAETQYHVTDTAVLDAIRCHTTGKPDMNPLEQILFIADYIEPNRKEIPHLADIRKEAFADPDRAICHILEDTLQYLRDKKKLLEPMTQTTYEWYLQKGMT